MTSLSRGAGRTVAAVLMLSAPLFVAAVNLNGNGSAAGAYEVQPGDTLWTISQRTGEDVGQLARDNRIGDPSQLRPGQSLVVSGRTPPPASAPAGPKPAAAPEAVRGSAVRPLLLAAAREQGVNPSLVEAVALWESGDNQAAISSTGAVGLMQIEPGTAEWAGPALLGRRVNIYQASDNARLGAALLRHYLDEFGDPRLALAAYYQGEAGTRRHGIYPSSRAYVDGIWALRNSIESRSS